MFCSASVRHLFGSCSVPVRFLFGSFFTLFNKRWRGSMDDRSQEILESLPQRPSRSRLAPYRELIHELRRRRRPYREIVQVLAEKCQCLVSISTLHDFVRTRSRSKRESANQPMVATRRRKKPGEAKESASEPAPQRAEVAPKTVLRKAPRREREMEHSHDDGMSL